MNESGVSVTSSPSKKLAIADFSASFKKSKAGRLKLVKTNEGYQTLRQEEQPALKDELVTVFENGNIVKEYTFEEIKENAKL